MKIVLAALLLCGCSSRALEVPGNLAGTVRDDLAVQDPSASDLAAVDFARADLARTSLDLAPFDLANGPERFVYAHSDSTLYAIDPTSLAIAQVGYFEWPNGGFDQMTDLALDRRGHMIGISYVALYAVDPGTARCTRIASVAAELNALTFVAGTDSAPGTSETLLGTAYDGTVYEIDPASGAQTRLGSYGQGWGSSGDLVSVAGVTYATVGGVGGDVLVTVDPATGAATRIGSTGVGSIWGLGYWKQTLFGLTELNGIVTIDTGTGVATAIPGTDSISFWGAGVTTAAPE